MMGLPRDTSLVAMQRAVSDAVQRACVQFHPGADVTVNVTRGPRYC